MSYHLAPVSSPAATPTPATNPNGPILEAFLLQVIAPGSSIPTPTAFFFIQDGSGNPVTNAAVTLVTPGGSAAATFFTVGNTGLPANSGVANINSGEYSVTISSYPVSQPCTFTASFNGASYSSTFTPVAANGAAVTGASGVTLTWTGGGNDNFVLVTGRDSFDQGPPLSSPTVLPASDFPLDPAGAGYDGLEFFLMQLTSSAFPGCKSSSVIGSGELLLYLY